jgi:tetratricopeptide (TPR) repeat protein
VPLELAEQPEIAIELLRTIGETQYDLGMINAGQALLDEVLARSRHLYGADHPEVAKHQAHIGTIYLSRRLYDRAEPHLADAARILRLDRRADPLELAGVLGNLSEAYRNTGRLDDADAAIQQVLALYRGRRPEHHPDVRAARARLAVLRRSQERWDEAEHLYREVLAATDADPASTPADIAGLTNNLAFLLTLQGKDAEAEPLYRRSLAATRETYGPASREGQVVANNLANALERQGKLGEAEALLRDEVELHRAHFPENHWRIGHSIGILAGFYQLTGQHRAAEARFRETLAIYRTSLGADAAGTLREQICLALSLVDLGRAGEAEAELLTVLDTLQRIDVTPSHRGSVEWALARWTEYEERNGGHELLARYRSRLAAAVAAR